MAVQHCKVPKVKSTIDIVSNIRDFNDCRDRERLAMKYEHMRSGAFAFMRGSCHLFYERFVPLDAFKSSPLVWCCGDLHLENFGSYKGDNRLVYFDANDFDEGALAPAPWELVRLLASVHVWASDVGLPDADVQSVCDTFLGSYVKALASGKAYWVERDTASGPVRDLLDALRQRQRVDHLNRRTALKGKKRKLLIDGEKTLAATEDQKHAVTVFVDAFAQTEEAPKFYEVLDVARRIAGTGSLGLDRYVVLVEGTGSPDGNYLLDLKEATPSAMASHLPTPQPTWPTQAHRIVELQIRFQAVPPAFLRSVTFNNKPYVLKALQPTQDRVNLARLARSLPPLLELAHTMGQVAAWGQLRSTGRQGSATADELMDWSSRSAWQRKLQTMALHCAEQTLADARTFAQAFDDGAFAG